MTQSTRCWWAALLPVIIAACGDDVEEEPRPQGDARARVLHYDYHLELESLRATSDLTVELVDDGHCIQLPIRSQGLGDVLIDGEPLIDGGLDNNVARLCGAGWTAGSTIAVHATSRVAEETWGDSQVGYSVSEDLEGQPFRYLVSWVGGCDRFGLCDSEPDRFATYQFTVSHAPDVDVLCPGTITAGDGETVCQFDHAGGPTYSTFGLAASSSWEVVDLGQWSGVDVALYDMPSANFAADLDVDAHTAFLGWMIEQFGPYPYGDQLRLAVGPTHWNGFEHPGNIVLNDLLNSPERPSAYAEPLTHVTNHEIAHMWAGDQTTLATVHDFVWKEAMVEYLVYVHEEETMALSVSRATAWAWERSAALAEYWPVPEEEPPLLDYYGDVYGAGPMVLFRQIEALFDRDAVLTALASLLGEERAIGVSDVKAALEESTGADLTAYFDAWVYGAGDPTWPAFDVEITPVEAGVVDITLHQRLADQGLFGCAFTITLLGAGDGEEYDVWVDLGPDGLAEHTVRAEPGFEVIDFDGDPDYHTLARFLAPQAAPPEPMPLPGGRSLWQVARPRR